MAARDDLAKAKPAKVPVRPAVNCALHLGSSGSPEFGKPFKGSEAEADDDVGGTALEDVGSKIPELATIGLIRAGVRRGASIMPLVQADSAQQTYSLSDSHGSVICL